jgi:hypothetical protein
LEKDRTEMLARAMWIMDALMPYRSEDVSRDCGEGFRRRFHIAVTGKGNGNNWLDDSARAI